MAIICLNENQLLAKYNHFMIIIFLSELNISMRYNYVIKLNTGPNQSNTIAPINIIMVLSDWIMSTDTGNKTARKTQF